ncbi:MAG: molecular chaperone, partial [Lysobacteraceae bacterium]
PVTIQAEAMDWRQADNRDRLSPSADLFTSPPIVRIAPGARQSVRVMARPPDGGEHAYRLLVSELPDAGDPTAGVQVLLQFSVPVFLRHDPKIAPQLSWSGQGGLLSVTNTGRQAAKLQGVSLDGAALPGQGLVYVLPGATRMLGPLAQAAQVQAREGRSGALLSAHVAP